MQHTLSRAWLALGVSLSLTACSGFTLDQVLATAGAIQGVPADSVTVAAPTSCCIPCEEPHDSTVEITRMSRTILTPHLRCSFYPACSFAPVLLPSDDLESR